MHTHIDSRAVAGQTGAVAILCSHHNSVCFSTVQVAPSAGGGVGETHMPMSIQACCHGNVRFGTVAGSPADWPSIKLTLYISSDITGNTRSWGKRALLNVHPEDIFCFLKFAIWNLISYQIWRKQHCWEGCHTGRPELEQWHCTPVRTGRQLTEGSGLYCECLRNRGYQPLLLCNSQHLALGARRFAPP